MPTEKFCDNCGLTHLPAECKENPDYSPPTCSECFEEIDDCICYDEDDEEDADPEEDPAEDDLDWRDQEEGRDG